VITSKLGGTDVVIESGDEMADHLLPAGLYGLDVETTWMGDREQFDPDFRVRTVQLATKDKAWVFDLADHVQRMIIERLLFQDDVTFCSHTTMDVVSVWVEFGIDISHRNIDTHQLAIQADPDKDHDRDLKALATAYGMPELEAAERVLHTHFLSIWPGRKNAKRADIHEHGWREIDVADPSFLEYAALDAVACRRLVEELVPATRNPPELLRVDHWLGVRSVRRKLAGLRVDPDRLADQLDETSRATGDAKSKAMELTGGVNISGPKIQPWLAEHGVDWSTWMGEWTGTGSPSLAKDNLSLLAQYPLDEVAQQVFAEMKTYREWYDLYQKTKAVDDRRVLSDGMWRIHPTLNPLGATTTARMSSSGPNVQNFSKKNPRSRGLLLPDPGYVLATIDFAQIELRVVAALAREEKMIETILGGGDLHDLTVDLLAELGVEIVRDTAKMGNFLIVYGGGPKALAAQAGIPLDVASEVVKGMREQYDSIARYSVWMGMEKEAVRTISNRRLPVTRNRKTREIRSYANVNYAVQSAARELLVQAWRDLEAKRPGIVWWPIHDELVLMIPEGEVAEVLADAEASMRFDFRGVPITADAVVLRDRDGTSRWMTGKLAEEIQKETAA
jgi:DNA polymerase-1